jgi:hypothetical protein
MNIRQREFFFHLKKRYFIYCNKLYMKCKTIFITSNKGPTTSANIADNKISNFCIIAICTHFKGALSTKIKSA